MAKTVKEVIQYFENLYATGAIYVWGMNSEQINETTILKTMKAHKGGMYDK